MDGQIETIKLKMLDALATFSQTKDGKNLIEDNEDYVYSLIRLFFSTELISIGINHSLKSEKLPLFGSPIAYSIFNDYDNKGIESFFRTRNLPSLWFSAVVVRWMKTNGDIVYSLKKAVESNQKRMLAGNFFCIDSPKYKLRLETELTGEIENGLHLKIYKNTPISAIEDFLDENKNVIRERQKLMKAQYPEASADRVDLVTSLKLCYLTKKKNQAKSKSEEKTNSDFQLTTDMLLAAKLLGPKYHKIENAKKGAKKIQQRRARFKESILNFP